MNATAVLISTVVVTSAVFALTQDNTLSQFEHLKEPRISIKKSERMLVVEAKGDPNVVGPRAFGLLFQLYYGLKEAPKGALQSPPRARWPLSLDTPRAEWIGLYALPVPETVTVLPQHQASQGLKASLTTWEYGEVAEVLHVGPYDREEPTIRRLKESIKQRGYTLLEGHEEEYIRGPTMTGRGDPDSYLTIIRYRVQKSGKRN
jgi:hypothetical protein